MKKSQILDFIVIAVFTAVLIPALSCSCTRTVYVPLQNSSLRTDTLHHTVLRCDTITVHDSVTTFIKGDTLLRTVVRDRTRTHLLRDTVNRIVHDTVIREILPATLSQSTSTQVISSLKKKHTSNLITFLIALAALSAYIAYRRIKHKN